MKGYFLKLNLKFIFIFLLVFGVVFGANYLPFAYKSYAQLVKPIQANLLVNSTINNSENIVDFSFQLKPEIAQLVTEKNIYNPPRSDVRLLVISDLNSAYGSTEYDEEVKLAIDLIPFWQPDVVVCGGDMVAGQKSSLTTAQIRAMWTAFDENIAQPLREMQMPFGFTIGNHDASSAVGFEKDKFLFQRERDLAVEYWHNRDHDSGVNFIDRFEYPFYYTFMAKDLFFLVWDGSSRHLPPEKLAWVEKSLSSAEAENAKMKIVIGHLPLYAVSIGRDSAGEVLDNAPELQKMLEKHNVHTYISGHHHAYYPAHKGNLQLLHTGILGSGPRPLLQGDFPPTKTVTVIDVNFDDEKLTTYTTYDMKNFDLITSQQLPRFIIGHNGMVVRRDIEWQNLTETEKLACVQKLGKTKCQ